MKNINKTFKYMAMAAVVLPMSLSLLTSCSEDENEEFLGRNEVKFTTAISGGIESRATVDYVPTDGNLTLYYDALGSTQHATYAHASDGWKCISTHPLYWDNFGKQTNYTFYAVAPSAEYGKVYADQSNIDDFVASDLLMARTAVDKVNTPVNLVLKHLMGKLVVNVLTTDGDKALTADELATTTVSISGLKTAYTVETGTTAETPAVATVSGDVSSHLTPNKASTAFSFIAPPQSTAGMELAFTITFAGQKSTYKYKVSEISSPNLTAGTITTFNITISKTELALAGVTVTDWATGEKQNAALLINMNGGNAWAPEVDGTLMLIYTGETTPYSVEYTYANGYWSNDVPLYWNQIDETNYVKNAFVATFLPVDNAPLFEVDALMGIGSTTAWGQDINLDMKHVMAMFSLTIEAGVGIADLATEIPTQEISIKKANLVKVKNDGTPDITLDDAISQRAIKDVNHFFVAPQPLTDAHAITLTHSNGNKYTLKLSDMKDANGNAIFPNGIEGGKKYGIVVTVNKNALNFSATIQDWTEISGSGNMTLDF